MSHESYSQTGKVPDKNCRAYCQSLKQTLVEVYIFLIANYLYLGVLNLV